MDWSWMNASRMSPAYEEGVEQFLEFAFERSRPDEDKKYFCPCINCLNGSRQVLDAIWEHLLWDEIKKNYTTWIWYGELTNMQRLDMGGMIKASLHCFRYRRIWFLRKICCQKVTICQRRYCVWWVWSIKKMHACPNDCILYRHEFE